MKPRLLLASLAIALSAVVCAAPAAAQTRLAIAVPAQLAAHPAVPFAGAAQADLTVVEYLDYNCPYCKLTHPEIQALLKSDPRVRVLYKDWPIFGGVSRYAAQVALASVWQGRYLQVHGAFLNFHGRLATQEQVRSLAKGAGVDLARLDRDLKARRAEVDAVLDRNDREARSLGLTGTPGLVIGRLLVPGGMPLASFQRLIAQERGGAR